MANTYYADFDLASGNNDGTSWTHAWKTLADAVAGSNGTAPAAGDTVYTRGTDTVAGTQTQSLAGSAAAGLIHWIGVNASGVNDGTRTIINGNGGNWLVLNTSGGYNHYENWAVTGSGNNHGWNLSASYQLLVNCASYSNGSSGFILGAMQYLFRCVAYSNTVAGFYYNGYKTDLLFCCSRDNGADGIFGNAGTGLYSTLIGCVVYDNGDKGFEDFCSSMMMFNCVLDNNAGGGFDTLAAQVRLCALVGSRITNHSGAGDIGANFLSAVACYGWNAFDGNTDHIANSTLVVPITNNGTATNSELNENGAGGGDTNQGYVSLTEGSEDYSTNYVSGTDPTLRRTAITIPTS